MGSPSPELSNLWLARAFNAVKGLNCTPIGGSYWKGKWSYQ